MPNIAPLIFVAALMFCVLSGVTLLAHIYNLNNIKAKTVGDGQHGTARWATKAEIKRVPARSLYPGALAGAGGSCPGTHHGKWRAAPPGNCCWLHRQN